MRGKEITMVTTTEDLLRLSIFSLTKTWDFNNESQISGISVWKTNQQVTARISYCISLTKNPYLEFHFSCNREPISYKMNLTTTTPFYGGKRWWFVCPVTEKRCAVLYFSDTYRKFVSRQAFDHLPYRSQNECIINRAIRKKHKLQDRYCKEGSYDTYFPKPKHMHKTTYFKLLDQLNHADSHVDFLMFKRFGANSF